MLEALLGKYGSLRASELQRPSPRTTPLGSLMFRPSTADLEERAGLPDYPDLQVIREWRKVHLEQKKVEKKLTDPSPVVAPATATDWAAMVSSRNGVEADRAGGSSRASPVPVSKQ